MHHTFQQYFDFLRILVQTEILDIGIGRTVGHIFK